MLMVAYPFIVFFGSQKIGMSNLALMLIALFIVRMLFAIEHKKPKHYLLAMAILVGGVVGRLILLRKISGMFLGTPCSCSVIVVTGN